MDQLITIGRIGAPRGIRGDVFVEPFTDDPQQRFAAGSVLRTDPADRGPLTVEKLDLGGARMVLRFVGAADREAVEALRGTHLVIEASGRPEIDDPDEFYTSDLVGLTVRTVDGDEIGRVAEIVDIAGSDYLAVGIDGAERLVPFVRAIVPTVSVAEGYLVIDPPDGLLEL